MSWATTTLSTTATLARHEKEILKQAGSTTRAAIYVPSTDTVWIDTMALAAITKGIFTYADGSTETVNVSASKIAFPKSQYIVKLDLYATAVLTYTFDCTEGRGATLTDSTGNVSVTTVESTGSWTGWVETDGVGVGDMTWADKIAVAKLTIGGAIEGLLTDQGITVDEAGGKVLLDTVTNPSIFGLASDYLCLSRIYLDLLNGGFSELFQKKYEIYTRMYEQELSSCLSRVNLDTALSGTTSTYRANIAGMVTR